MSGDWFRSALESALDAERDRVMSRIAEALLEAGPVHAVPPSAEQASTPKIGGYLVVSNEAGTATVYPVTHTERPPVSRLTRWRWRLSSWWYDHRPRVHLGPCDDGSDW